MLLIPLTTIGYDSELSKPTTGSLGITCLLKLAIDWDFKFNLFVEAVLPLLDFDLFANRCFRDSCCVIMSFFMMLLVLIFSSYIFSKSCAACFLVSSTTVGGLTAWTRLFSKVWILFTDLDWKRLARRGAVTTTFCSFDGKSIVSEMLSCFPFIEYAYRIWGLQNSI